jgi:hypothetical protein
MSYSNYGEYLRHPIFLGAVESAKQRSGGLCEKCGSKTKTEPHHSASVPLYEKDYQPRFWEKLTRAGLVHDHMLCFPKAALRILEAKTMTAKP